MQYILPIYCSAILYFIGTCIYINTTRKVIYSSNHIHGWLDVNEHMIPDDLRSFLATDGKEVREVYQSKYNRFGKPIMGCSDGKIITHWMPYPSPPKTKGK